MRLEPHNRESKIRAEMKTNVNSENTRDSYVKFCPRIERNDEKFGTLPSM